MRRYVRSSLLTVLHEHLVDYPTPSNLNYFWSFGSLAGIFLAVQIITGVFLAMHYTPHTDMAFTSIEHIMRDVNYGWLIRYLHSNGASMFFPIVYCHIARGFYYGSFSIPRVHTWQSGLLIFVLMMATAFMGYVLPWGQMSFWGATVITNSFTAIPLLGNFIVHSLWGGFAITNATLNRFYSLHYLLPFIIVFMVFVHLISLHETGSNNPLGTNSKIDILSFHPYFYVKDLHACVVVFIGYFIVIFFYPNTLGHPDNYIEANALVTPAHIVPEWYFLPFYAIPRSIPNKMLGVLCMFSAILILFFLPHMVLTYVRSTYFRPLAELCFRIFIFIVLLLGWVGAQPAEEPYITIGQAATLNYFFMIVLVLPYLANLDARIISTLISK